MTATHTAVTLGSKTVLALDTLGSMTRNKTILFVWSCPKWPRQVQWWLLCVSVIGIIAGIIALNFANVNTA